MVSRMKSESHSHAQGRTFLINRRYKNREMELLENSAWQHAEGHVVQLVTHARTHTHTHTHTPHKHYAQLNCHLPNSSSALLSPMDDSQSSEEDDNDR